MTYEKPFRTVPVAMVTRNNHVAMASFSTVAGNCPGNWRQLGIDLGFTTEEWPIKRRDHPEMVEFGLALDMGSRSTTLDERISESLPIIAAAEELGFDSLWFGESYPTSREDPAIFHLPSPGLVISALARETGMRFGTGVNLLRAWDPLRLAYETAELDQITSGRLTVGIGLGQPDAAVRFHTGPRGSADIDRIVIGLRRLWSGESFSFRDDELSESTSLWPLPVQRPHLPMLVGGGIPRAAVRAATLADGFYASTGSSTERIEKLAQAYRAALPLDASASITTNRLTLLASTPDQVRERTRGTTDRILDSYLTLGGQSDEGEYTDADARRQAFENSIALIGTPEDVRIRLKRLFDIGITGVQFRVFPESLSTEYALETVRLLGQEVLPWCREYVARSVKLPL